MIMFNEPAVFVDIETNGGNGFRGRIIEIGAVRVENGEIVDTLNLLINPGSTIPHWITNLTGITQNDLVNAPYLEDVAFEIREFLKDAIFVAHNVRFDYSFIKRELEASGYTFKPKLFCTVRMSRHMYPENKGHSLEKIITRHGIITKTRHRAYDDAKAIYDFTKLAIAEKGSEAFISSLEKQLKTRTLPPNLDESLVKNVSSSPGVYIFESEDGMPLYVGKSINLRSRILSHFASDTKMYREMKLSQNSFKVRTIETDTELEALLLESQMIKELLPLYNRKLRRAYTQTVFMRDYDENGYCTIRLENKDLAKVTDLSNIYGVYTTKLKARSVLENALKTYQLCPKLLGLEKSSGPCFSYQLGKCRGACIGKEAPELYNRRIETALERSKIESWPFKSAIAITLKSGRSIVVDQWIITGYLEPVENEEPYYKKIESSFDLDTYKILSSFIRLKKSEITISPYYA